MNLYSYLRTRSCNVVQEAKKAYERFQAHVRKTLEPWKREVDPFVFAFTDNGYQAFAFGRDQVVDAPCGLAIVTGWVETPSGWRVSAKTAKGESRWEAEELKPAAFPEGLVEILRGRVHGKVDEAFA